MIRTAAVIHDELNVRIYRLLADFFRFCGVNVFNYSVTDHSELVWIYEFDAVFIDETGSRLSLEPSQRKRLEDRYPENRIQFNNDERAWNDLDTNENGERKGFLCSVIDRLAKQGRLQDEDHEVLKFLAKLFVDHEIMKNRIILQSFLNISNFIRKARENFVNSYVALLKCPKKAEWQDNSCFWYAQRYLDQSINEACGFLDEDMLLTTEKVVRGIEGRIQLSADQPQFQAKLYLTIAHLYLSDFFLQKKCTAAFREAESLSLGSALESYAAYQLGRSMEKQLGDWNSAIKYYMRSLRLVPDEYRAVYKVAVYHWKQKNDIESACEYFKRIDAILQDRYDLNVLQPREAEYLYKAWHFILEIIRENGDVPVNGIPASEAETKMQAILQKIKDVKRENHVYTLIFGRDAQIDSADPISPKVDARTALAERVKAVCTL